MVAHPMRAAIASYRRPSLPTLAIQAWQRWCYFEWGGSLAAFGFDIIAPHRLVTLAIHFHHHKTDPVYVFTDIARILRQYAIQF